MVMTSASIPPDVRVVDHELSLLYQVLDNKTEMTKSQADSPVVSSGPGKRKREHLFPPVSCLTAGDSSSMPDLPKQQPLHVPLALSLPSCITAEISVLAVPSSGKNIPEHQASSTASASIVSRHSRHRGGIEGSRSSLQEFFSLA